MPATRSAIQERNRQIWQCLRNAPGNATSKYVANHTGIAFRTVVHTLSAWHTLHMLDSERNGKQHLYATRHNTWEAFLQELKVAIHDKAPAPTTTTPAPNIELSPKLRELLGSLTLNELHALRHALTQLNLPQITP